jgi:hypothetical protein
MELIHQLIKGECEYIHVPPLISIKSTPPDCDTSIIAPITYCMSYHIIIALSNHSNLQVYLAANIASKAESTYEVGGGLTSSDSSSLIAPCWKSALFSLTPIQNVGPHAARIRCQNINID